ncbi:MAG: hypothetical protein HY841_05610 [Bacteroidetes bacterium]|nr:hypothetical protein [Bacteroidota bacterium]
MGQSTVDFVEKLLSGQTIGSHKDGSTVGDSVTNKYKYIYRLTISQLFIAVHR